MYLAFIVIINKILSHQFVSLPFLFFSSYVRVLEVQTSNEFSLATYTFEFLVWSHNCKESSFRYSLQWNKPSIFLIEREEEHYRRKKRRVF